MSAREKIAYLKGLIDGQNMADTPQKATFYTALVDALDSIAEAMDEHNELHQELNDYLETLDEDITEIEDTLDVLLDDEDIDFDDDCDCDCCNGDLDEEEYASVRCPHCVNDFYFEPAAYNEDEELLCPHCGKSFKYGDGAE